jgi:hypothetical protein
LTERGRRFGGMLVFKWSDCTRTKRVGQYHKNCATVGFSFVDSM